MLLGCVIDSPSLMYRLASTAAMWIFIPKWTWIEFFRYSILKLKPLDPSCESGNRVERNVPVHVSPIQLVRNCDFMKISINAFFPFHSNKLVWCEHKMWNIKLLTQEKAFPFCRYLSNFLTNYYYYYLSLMKNNSSVEVIIRVLIMWNYCSRLINEAISVSNTE